MEKLAANLGRMEEDDLLLIVQLIQDKKSPETMTKHDVERESPGKSISNLHMLTMTQL